MRVIRRSPQSLQLASKLNSVSPRHQVERERSTLLTLSRMQSLNVRQVKYPQALPESLPSMLKDQLIYKPFKPETLVERVNSLFNHEERDDASSVNEHIICAVSQYISL